MVNKILREKTFIVDEDTYEEVLSNSNFYNKKGCERCLKCKKKIITKFAKDCGDFEENILINRQNGIRIQKKKYGVYSYFEEEELKTKYNVISAVDFTNVALTNIIFNTPECNNIYFRVGVLPICGKKLKCLDDNKYYIKIYIDIIPKARSRIPSKK